MVSLNSPMANDDNYTLTDTLQDMQLGTPDINVIAYDSSDTLNKLIQRLDSRDRTILSMRFGLDGEGTRTLREVGKKIGRTPERVRQLQLKALNKLKKLYVEIGDENKFN